MPADERVQLVMHALFIRIRELQGIIVRHAWQNCNSFCSNLAAVASTTSLASMRANARTPLLGSLSLHGNSARGRPQPATSSGRISKEEVGRASWTFLHALAAQYPEKPSRQQVRDVKNLMDIFTRIYPCAECAKHFKEIVRASPVRAGSRRELQLWMCEAHNAVNRSIGKPSFNCAMVEARWGALDCDDQDACSLAVGGR